MRTLPSSSSRRGTRFSGSLRTVAKSLRLPLFLSPQDNGDPYSLAWTQPLLRSTASLPKIGSLQGRHYLSYGSQCESQHSQLHISSQTEIIESGHIALRHMILWMQPAMWLSSHGASSVLTLLWRDTNAGLRRAMLSLLMLTETSRSRIIGTMKLLQVVAAPEYIVVLHCVKDCTIQHGILLYKTSFRPPGLQYLLVRPLRLLLLSESSHT